MELFILAGGLGTRLRELVKEVPKPMALVKDEPFLNHVMRYWKKQGIKKIYISIGYLGKVIKDYYGKSFEGTEILYIIENTPLGTGGAFLKFLKEFNPSNPFLMINGDTFFKVDLLNIEKYHNSVNSILTICAFQTENSDRYSNILYNEKGRIIKFGFKNSFIKEKITCNGGVYVISPSIKNYLFSYKKKECSLENDLFNFLIARNKNMFVKVYDSPFLDIGLPNDYKRAKEFLEKGT